MRASPKSSVVVVLNRPTGFLPVPTAFKTQITLSRLTLPFFKEAKQLAEEKEYDFSEEGYHKLITLGQHFILKVINESSPNEFPWRIAWLKSVFDFYELGMKKQEEGQHPKILISW